jgi:hypothetical protein
MSTATEFIYHAADVTCVRGEVYVPQLAPDFAYIHAAPFYELLYFDEVYRVAAHATANFTRAPSASSGSGTSPSGSAASRSWQSSAASAGPE